MGIDIECNPDTAVPEAFTHYLWVDVTLTAQVSPLRKAKRVGEQGIAQQLL